MNNFSIESHCATHSSPHCARALVFQRRLGVSPSVARLYVGHAYGDGQRGDLAQLAILTADRVAASVGVRS